MIGAPALAATAALRTGCGLCRIVAAPNVLPFCLTIEPSATGIALADDADAAALDAFVDSLDDKSVLAVGPGMGTGQYQSRRVQRMLQQSRPVVLDADGLNNLAALPDVASVRRCPAVLTPHPGEYRRLADALKISADPVDPDTRPNAAAKLAEALGAVVALKGHHTVVSDGARQYINNTGNPALATAGSGDVLTGMIASLIAQGMELFDATALGVFLHGKAADAWAQQHGPAGLVARDLATIIPDVIEQHRRAHGGA